MTFCQIEKLEATRDSPFGSMPVKIFTEHSDLYAPVVQHFDNESIDDSKLLLELQQSDIIFLFKTVMLFKQNYSI